MKLAFSTIALPGADVTELIALAERHGAALEIRSGVDGRSLLGIPFSEVGRLKAMLDGRGVGVSDIASGVCIKDYREEQILLLCDTLKAARELGAIGVRVFLGNFISRHSAPMEYSYAGIVRALKEAAAYAEEIGGEIWIETHNEFSTGKVLRRLLDDIGSSAIKVIWDIIHPIEQKEPPEDTLKYLGESIAHVHIKDGVPMEERDLISYRYTRLGEGVLPIKEILALLKENNYKGYISLEWEVMWREELRGLYPDGDSILFAFEEFMKNCENMLTMDAWGYFGPKVGREGEYKIDKKKGSLYLKASDEVRTFVRVAATADVEGGKSYKFSAKCKTKAELKNIYVLYTTIKENGGWGLRDHMSEVTKTPDGYTFCDVIVTDSEAVQIKIELELMDKGTDAEWTDVTLTECEAPAPRCARVALAFIKDFGARTVEDCEKKIYDAIERTAACKPDLMVLSEEMLTFGTGTGLDYAESDDGKVCTGVRALAKKHGCYIVYNFLEKRGEDYYNTSMLIGRDGETVGKYSKTQLTLGELERGLTPGDEYPVFETDFGRVGMLICYDHYFPHTADLITEAGAEIICVSTIGDSAEKGVARAMDNGVYMAICGHHTYNRHGWGPGKIISPTGDMLAMTDNEEDIAYADIDFSKRIRRRWLSLGPADSYIHDVYRFAKNHIE